MRKRSSIFLGAGAILTGAFVFFLYFFLPHIISLSYNTNTNTEAAQLAGADGKDIPEKDVFVVTHVPVPQAVRAIYMTQCVGGTPSFREKLVRLIEETELN